MKRSLTQTQAAELLRAASVLPPAQRDGFFAAVDSRLVGVRRPLTDDDVSGAIVATLGDSQTVTTHCFMCDAIPTVEASMARRSDDDDDPFDERGILKDGHKVRISMQMRDAASVRDTSARLFDERRPGPVYGGDRSAAAKAYEDAAREAEQAWKMLPEPAEAADGRRQRRVTTRDPFGHETGTEDWEEDAACVLPPTRDAAEGRRRKQASYDAMVRENCDAWRNPSPLPAATDAALSPHRRNAAPLTPTFDVEEGRRRKREAYDRMCREDADAWKDPSR